MWYILKLPDNVINEAHLKKKQKRTSEILLEIAEDKSLSGNLTFQSILQMFGDRTFGVAFLFFALPGALPLSIIPGVSVLFGVPIMIFAIQMVLAGKTLWLPNKVANQVVSHDKVAKIIYAAKPYLIKVEKLLKPRLAVMTSRPMEILNGLIIFCLALLLMVPIPFSNFIFASLIIIFSLGIIEKDGVFIIIGYVAFLTYIVLGYFFIVVAIQNILKIFT